MAGRVAAAPGGRPERDERGVRGRIRVARPAGGPEGSGRARRRRPRPVAARRVEQRTGEPHPGAGEPYWRSVARVGVQAADALQSAADAGTLHRDAKPANLLSDVRGNVWVADFGLAKLAEVPDLTRRKRRRHPAVHGPRTPDRPVRCPARPYTTGQPAALPTGGETGTGAKPLSDPNAFGRGKPLFSRSLRAVEYRVTPFRPRGIVRPVRCRPARPDSRGDQNPWVRFACGPAAHLTGVGSPGRTIFDGRATRGQN